MKFAKFLAAFLAAAIAFGCFAACTPDKGNNNEKGNDPEYFTVTFDLDGGEVKGKDISQGVKVESGTQLALENYKPEKSGHNFEGWLSGETNYAANAQITVNADIELKALWELIPVEKFTVTFDPAGGTLNDSAETLTFQAEKNYAINFSDYVPERDTYTFKGWKTGETLFNGGTYTVTDNVDFIAKWIKNPSADENFVFEETEAGDGYIIKDLAANSEITEIVVPGYYQNKPVLKIANNVFDHNGNFTAVDLSNCDKLQEIGDWNFSDCSALTSVNLEGCSSLKKIGGSCFSSGVNGSSALTEINLKGLSALEEIGSGFFAGNQYSNGSIPVEILDFSDCVSLKTIGQESFWYLTKLKELDFSKTQLQTFARQTIHYSPALEVLKLPKTLKLTHEGADGTLVTTEFCSHCENLKEIILDPLNIFMTMENGALMDADKTVIYKYAVKSDATKFTAPATVKTVMNWAFYKATNLTEIDFSATKLTEIKNSAFAGCTNALLKVPFGSDGTYADKSAACILGSKWNDDVKDTQYSEAAKVFRFDTDLVDGKSVIEASFTFTASAKYGPSYDIASCELTVKFNGSEISGDKGSYTVTLKDGENTIELIASSGNDTETKTYKVNKVDNAEIECSMDKDIVNSTTDANYSFTVKLKSEAGGYIDFSARDVTVEIDCGFSASFTEPGTGLTKAQTDNTTVTVTFDYEALLGWYFDVDKQFNCRITVNLSGLKFTAQFKMIYEG